MLRKLLNRLAVRTPGLITSAEIQILYNTTARAFGARSRRVWNCSPDKALSIYARFTSECLKRGDVDSSRLYQEAYRTGRAAARITGVRNSEDVSQLIFWLYRNIGISMGGKIPGEVKVDSCYFSRIYTPEQCKVMSSVDSGIIAGIAGDGSLEFSERITDGSNCCRACFVTNGEKTERYRYE